MRISSGFPKLKKGTPNKRLPLSRLIELAELRRCATPFQALSIISIARVGKSNEWILKYVNVSHLLLHNLYYQND